ncbi:hypothetical protein ScPMuIL_002042 [Solemya velum]
MNLDSLSFAVAEISYLVANLTKKNFKSSVSEINHLVTKHGAEADRHLFRCLFSHVDFSGDGKSSGKDFHQTQFLIQECGTLLSKPNFLSILCYTIDNPLHHQKSLKPSAQLFPQISKVLKLSRVQEVVFGFALLNSSSLDTRTYASHFIKHKLPDLLRSYVDADTTSRQEGGLLDIAIEVLHYLLTHLFKGKEQFGIGADQKEAFLKTLKKDFPLERVPIILSPLLYPEIEDVPLKKLEDIANMPKSVMDASLADIILEAGYSCTTSVEECRSTLIQFGVREITPASVAKLIGMMARTPASLGEPSVSILSLVGSGAWPDSKETVETPGVSTWNVDVLVQVLHDLTPHLNWQEVVAELDHPGFLIVNKNGLKILIQGLVRGLNEVFPINLVYRPWKNTEGQLSFIVQSLRNPDVFCFADYQCHSVVIEILKAAPDEDKRDIATWKSLDLVETLLRLSDAGHHQQITELFKFPLQNCPDMLVLALLQITPSWNTLKQELISMLMPIFLGNHPNSAVVLHYAWHCQGHSSTIRTLIMHAMAEWYMRGEPHDQTRLSRILDVAQDLKALSMLLNATPFAFVIDLACLASRREYLKLDKWLTDKIREHREPFIQTCVTFLKRRCPQLTGAPVKDDQQPQMKSHQLPPDTIATMLACLQTWANQVSQELSEAIFTMYTNANVILNKRQPPPGVVGAKSVNSNLGTGIGNPLEGIDSSNRLNMSKNWGVAPGVSSGFPQSLAASLTTASPGSPAKSFSSMSQATPSPVFGAIQNITTQLQTLSLQTTNPIGTQGPPSSRAPGVNSLGQLSAQVAMKQQSFDRLRQGKSPGDIWSTGFGTPGGDVPKQFPDDVQEEVTSYFRSIFNQASHTTVDEVLELLKRFKDSTHQKEKEVCECMLRYLFDEFTFLDDYPETELHTIAVLFGGIVENGLVPYTSLGYALRYVLEALKNNPGSKKYSFGIQALDRFKLRLKENPQYCQHLAAITHFHQFPQHLIDFIEFGARSQEPPQSTAVPMLPQVSRSHTPTMLGLPTLSAQTAVVSSATANTIPSIIGMNPSISQPVIVPMNPPPSVIGPPSGVMSTPAGLPPTSVHAGSPLPLPSSTPTSVSTPVEGLANIQMSSTTSTTSTTQSGTAAKPASVHKPSIATATNIDTLLAGQGKEEISSVPPESLQDKVFFIFNNLSLANMNQKSDELKKEVTSEYIMWVAQYLVMKRASIEPNFHTLYANFVDALQITNFTQMVIKETFRNIKVLLKSDKGDANFSDRTLLKNLGHWLGMLTLAKNKPILQIDIDLKALLYEAYHKGARDLLYVVPFTAKVLESCAKSKVFRYPNPWTTAIMNVLAELHEEPELKLNLKFEIEVLCKTMSLELKDLKATNYLKDTSRLPMLEYQLSAPGAKPSTPQPEPPVAMTAAPVTLPPTTTTMTMTTTASTPMPPQPRFSFDDIVTTSFAGLSPYIVINEQVTLLQANPQLKQFVRTAIEKSVHELLPPVVERSIKFALPTCEQIIKKDFALDPEETRMRAAAHHMVRHMTAGMALITCREPLYITITNNLKNAFMATLRGANQSQKELIEQAAQMIAQENTDLACAFIQKTAVERAIPEIDKRLATEIDLRKHARIDGRRYCDPVVLTYQAERMPEQIRLKVGGVTTQQIAVYEEFARNIPGFMAVSEQAVPVPQGVSKPMPSYPTDDIAHIYERVGREIEQHLQQLGGLPPTNHPAAHLHALYEAVLLARTTRELSSAMTLLQKAVEGLLDHYTGMQTDTELMFRFRECHLLVLKGLQDSRAYGKWVNQQVTRCLLECRDEHKYNFEALDCLIRNQLVNIQQYDLYLMQSMDSGHNLMAIAFAMQLVQRYCIDEKHNAQFAEIEFPSTVEALTVIAARPRQSPEGLTTLIEALRQSSDFSMLDRAPGGPTSMMQSGISQAREFDDPPGLHDTTECLLRDWVNMYHSPQAGRDSTKVFSAFVQQMHQNGILKTDDLITRFFRLCTEMCVDLCYRALGEQTHSPTVLRAKCFHTLDAFVRLIALLVKHSGDTANTITKINLLNKVLGIVAGVLLQDHEVRQQEFQQLPYHRIFIMLFIELNAPEHILESINFQVLTAFCNTFHVLRPAKAPGFAYAWLELISHRVFIGRMLSLTPQQRGWGMYAQLLIDLFKFLAPFLRNADLARPTQLLYKGTLRVLLVLLHDFPEFLCDYHYAFCDVIPPNCIQMRNLILSAFPRNMRLPDPFTPNLKVDMLADIAHPPRILTNFANMIQPMSFKKDLDSYLKVRSQVTFLSDLRSNLQSNEPGTRYNIPLINALVLYVGTQAIQYIHSKSLTPCMSTIAHSSHMDIFQNLSVDLDTEGRYLFLTAIANQLRYPNSHTHYFSCTLLYLFAETNTEAIQEQITRVLLERLIVNRPHPWGLLITFIELIKNPQFKFWNHDFVHCAPEIEKLFESVARSCMQPKQVPGVREQEVTEIH